MPAVIENGKTYIITDLIDVSGTDPKVLYTCMPPYNKFTLHKVYIYNKDSEDHEVILGAYDTTGASWSQDKLILKVTAGSTVILGPDDLPRDFVMTTDPSTAIMAWAAKLDAAVTANNVKVKLELVIL